MLAQGAFVARLGCSVLWMVFRLQVSFFGHSCSGSSPLLQSWPVISPLRAYRDVNRHQDGSPSASIGDREVLANVNGCPSKSRRRWRPLLSNKCTLKLNFDNRTLLSVTTLVLWTAEINPKYFIDMPYHRGSQFHRYCAFKGLQLPSCDNPLEVCTVCTSVHSAPSRDVTLIGGY